MIKIYSKIQPDLLLHIIFRKEDFKEGRQEIIDPKNYIQCAALQLYNGQTFKPHKHNKNTFYASEKIAQESWVVIEGKVRCVFYDIDDKIIAKPILCPGDASFTLYGGHTYQILENNTIVFEFKSGPYINQEYDKTFINEIG